MSTLSMRLKALQVPGETPKFNFDHMSMKQLEDSVIDFGQAQLGLKYQEAWERHQDWVTWFINKYEKSAKESHQRFLHYVQLKIERAELDGTNIPLNAGPKTSAMKPKTKPKAAPRQIYQAPVATMPNMEEEELFELLSAEEEMSIPAVEVPGNQVQHLETRMLHMEDALSRILAHLENPGPTPEDQ